MASLSILRPMLRKMLVFLIYNYIIDFIYSNELDLFFFRKLCVTIVCVCIRELNNSIIPSKTTNKCVIFHGKSLYFLLASFRSVK